MGLKISEELPILKRALNAISRGILITDCAEDDDPIIYVNQAFLSMSGYHEDEVIGKNCRFMQGEDTDPVALKELAKAVHARQEVTVKLVNYRKNGESFTNEFTVFPVTDDAGKVTHCVALEKEV